MDYSGYNQDAVSDDGTTLFSFWNKENECRMTDDEIINTAEDFLCNKLMLKKCDNMLSFYDDIGRKYYGESKTVLGFYKSFEGSLSPSSVDRLDCMNDMMTVYLNNEKVKDEDELEKLIERMDEILLEHGVEYSGFRNMYLPVDKNKRDDVVFDAVKALEDCEWLKGIYAYSLVGNQRFNGKIKDIDVSNMSLPSPAKMAYYEEYYAKYKKLAHGILVDNNNRIVDGY